MLDIGLHLRVHVDALIAAQNDMGVCDAIRRNALVGKPVAMSAPHLPKVAGIDPTVPVSAHTAAPLDGVLSRARSLSSRPSGRLGLRPHHAARAHRAPGRNQHPRRRVARAAGCRCGPRRRPPRADRLRTLRPSRAGLHHRSRTRPRRARPHRDGAAQRNLVRQDPGRPPGRRRAPDQPRSAR